VKVAPISSITDQLDTEGVFVAMAHMISNTIRPVIPQPNPNPNPSQLKLIFKSIFHVGVTLDHAVWAEQHETRQIPIVSERQPDILENINPDLETEIDENFWQVFENTEIPEGVTMVLKFNDVRYGSLGLFDLLTLRNIRWVNIQAIDCYFIMLEADHPGKVINDGG